MVQCEMCGTETATPNRVKIEGAELDVCDNCTDFGTEVQTGGDSASTSTKYSTKGTSTSGSKGTSSRSSSTGGSTGGSPGGSGSSGGRRTPDIYDDIEELAEDFDDRLRTAREDAQLSQEELAKRLNEKASLIRKLEHGDTLPTDEMQRKLESELDVDLSESASVDDTEWESEGSTGGYTLGDVVERKDS